MTPQIRIRRVEVVLKSDMPDAEKLIRRALESRSGHEVLPLELEDELRAVFDPDVTHPQTDANGETDTENA